MEVGLLVVQVFWFVGEGVLRVVGRQELLEVLLFRGGRGSHGGENRPLAVTLLGRPWWDQGSTASLFCILGAQAAVGPMRSVILLSLLALLAFAPSAEASCHMCLEAAAESCGSADVGGCAGDAGHLATHAPDLALAVVDEAQQQLCPGSC